MKEIKIEVQKTQWRDATFEVARIFFKERDITRIVAERIKSPLFYVDHCWCMLADDGRSALRSWASETVLANKLDLE